MQNETSILLVYTGGTIGMKQDPVSFDLRPFDFSQILEEVPELKKFGYRIDTYSFDPVIDSSDVDIEFWKRLTRLIEENYCKYDGFVILHGTDTMSFSASALSFMLGDITKPVVFTGSQLPIGMLRTGQKSPLSRPHSPRPSRRCKANRSKPFKNPPECKAYVKRCHISFFHALLGKLPLNSL